MTQIGAWAFDGCSNLTSITLPSSLTSIGEYAFQYCSLTSITIPEGVTQIGEYAFSGCSNLTSVVIESDDIYKAANETDYNQIGYLLEYATTVKVLKKIDDGSNTYLSSTFSVDKESDEKYNIYTKL